ncbi:DsbA family protein [Ferrovibrio sp.]|uniref:DsbA family protein n=1 Tax=Ferrovibrio sp. TaxID=1917215 RepID=UPI0025C65500|nr:DsbA family protein [Ferrovibrio sp.]MBX3456186.1 thioredoxin domain-containing protein [Ferrovibrio sp.]
MGFPRTLIGLWAAFAFLFAAPVMAQEKDAFSPEQRKQLESLVRDILVKNPKILIEAMHALEEQQQQERLQAASAAIRQNAKALMDDGFSFVAGNPKGDVTLVEFFDYRCGYCKQMQPAVLDLLKQDGKLRVVLKELPVLGPESVLAARAAIAAIQQPGGKYMAYHNAMMAFRGKLDEAQILRMAKEAGLDTDKLKAEMASPRTSGIIQENLKLAETLGIEGTPAFVIGDNLVPGATSPDTLRMLIQKARGG